MPTGSTCALADGDWPTDSAGTSKSWPYSAADHVTLRSAGHGGKDGGELCRRLGKSSAVAGCADTAASIFCCVRLQSPCRHRPDPARRVCAPIPVGRSRCGHAVRPGSQRDEGASPARHVRAQDRSAAPHRNARRPNVTRHRHGKDATVCSRWADSNNSKRRTPPMTDARCGDRWPCHSTSRRAANRRAFLTRSAAHSPTARSGSSTRCHSNS